MAYSKHTWKDGETITDILLNNIEKGIEDANNGIPSDATKSKPGIVKQAAFVSSVTAEDAGTVGAEFNQVEVQKIATLATDNKASINEIIDALKSAGIMASS